MPKDRFSTKEYNLKRHYDTLHKHKFEKYKGKERKNVLQSFKDKQKKQVSTMFNFVSNQKTSLAESYEVALCHTSFIIILIMTM